jgi:hypothetical protein
VNTIEILAVIGGITVILTAATKIPAALAEFLRACILVADAARDLRAAITWHAPRDEPMAANPEAGTQRTRDINADDSGN